MARKVLGMDERLRIAVLAEESPTAVARRLGVSRQWVYVLRARFAAEGIDGLLPRPRAPRRVANRTPAWLEERIVWLRKNLEPGANGPGSIRFHLAREGVRPLPAESTVYRVLRRRGFVEDHPERRPRRATRRFEHPNPNDCWQFDATVCSTGRGPTEVLSVLDDCSRYLVLVRVVGTLTTEAAWAGFLEAVSGHGVPAAVLSDNGLAFSGRLRGVEVAFEANLRALGVVTKTARPYHPQTCGKVERLHQTLKRWLGRRLPADAAELAALLEEFRHWYNHRRPHRALGGATPAERYFGSPRAPAPAGPLEAPLRITHGVVGPTGVVHLRRWDIHVGVEHRGLPVAVALAGEWAVVTHNGTVLRRLRLDPTRRYQPSGRPRGGPRRPRPHA
jgi:transposase InsO family protein